MISKVETGFYPSGAALTFKPLASFPYIRLCNVTINVTKSKNSIMSGTGHPLKLQSGSRLNYLFVDLASL